MNVDFILVFENSCLYFIEIAWPGSGIKGFRDLQIASS